MRLLWELNQLSTTVQAAWPYKEMLTAQRWSNARPTGRVRCWQVQCGELKTGQKKVQMPRRQNNLPFWVWLTYDLHCPKNKSYKVQTEAIKAGVQVTYNSIHMYWMSCFCSHTRICGSKTRHIPLHQLQPWQTRFLCGDSDYFWDSAYCQEGRQLLCNNM